MISQAIFIGDTHEGDVRFTFREIKLRLPPLTLIIGGASSGKSAFAERLVLQSGLSRVYIATAEARDAEMEAKIARHRARRLGQGWRTVEAPLDLELPLGKIQSGEIALVDCVTFWLTNQMLDDADVEEEIDVLLRHARGEMNGARSVIVTNDVSGGIVPGQDGPWPAPFARPGSPEPASRRAGRSRRVRGSGPARRSSRVGERASPPPQPPVADSWTEVRPTTRTRRSTRRRDRGAGFVVARLWWVRHGPTHQTTFTGWRDVPADLSDAAALDRLDAYLLARRYRCVPPILSGPRPRRIGSRAVRTRLPDTDQLREFDFRGVGTGSATTTWLSATRLLSRAFWDNPGDVRRTRGRKLLRCRKARVGGDREARGRAIRART